MSPALNKQSRQSTRFTWNTNLQTEEKEKEKWGRNPNSIEDNGPQTKKQNAIMQHHIAIRIHLWKKAHMPFHPLIEGRRTIGKLERSPTNNGLADK